MLAKFSLAGAGSVLSPVGQCGSVFVRFTSQEWVCLFIYFIVWRGKNNQDMLKADEISSSCAQVTFHGSTSTQFTGPLSTAVFCIMVGDLWEQTLASQQIQVIYDGDFPQKVRAQSWTSLLGRSLCFLWNCRLWTRNSWTPTMSQNWTKMQVTRRWVLWGWASRALARTPMSLVTRWGGTLPQRFWRDFWFLLCSLV